MSLPLRLPYSYPERRCRGALWLADFCAPVTPRPRLPRLLVGDRPEHEGGSAEGCLEAAAWAQGGSCGRSASGGGTGATHLGLASLGSLYAPRPPACAHLPPGAQGLNTMPSTPRALVVARHPTGPLGSRGQPALRFWNSRGWRKGA